jgi:hypothetical protein
MGESTEHLDRADALGRALRRLPLAAAPPTLLPRVMAAIALRMRRADPTWFDWPLWAQMTSALAFTALVALSAIAWPHVGAAVTDQLAEVRAHGVVRLVVTFLRSFWLPVVLGLAGAITLTALVCATVGALLGRVALGGASR